MVSIYNSGGTVHKFIPNHPDSVIIQDVIENVVIEDVHCSHILEDGDISENVIIPQQILHSDITEEVSLSPYTIPDILSSDIMTASLSIPEHVLTSEAFLLSDVGDMEHMFHDSIMEAEVISDPLTNDISEVLVGDYASEAFVDSIRIATNQQDDAKSNFEDYLPISCKCGGTFIIKDAFLFNFFEKRSLSMLG